MKEKKPWVFIGICIFIFVAGIVGSLFLMRPIHGNIVEIVQDNIVLHTLDLSKCDDQFIEIEYRGRINVISVEQGSIQISSADCPDNTCVKMGYLGKNGLPIVCLPNRLVIRFSTGNEDLDAVAR